MGDNRNRVDDSTLALISKHMADGLSAAEIGERLHPKRSRNAVLGLIDRHLKATPRSAKRHHPKTERKGVSPPPRQTVFSEPSPVRKFSWEDQPSV